MRLERLRIASAIPPVCSRGYRGCLLSCLFFGISLRWISDGQVAGRVTDDFSGEPLVQRSALPQLGEGQFLELKVTPRRGTVVTRLYQVPGFRSLSDWDL